MVHICGMHQILSYTLAALHCYQNETEWGRRGGGDDGVGDGRWGAPSLLLPAAWGVWTNRGRPSLLLAQDKNKLDSRKFQQLKRGWWNPNTHTQTHTVRCILTQIHTHAHPHTWLFREEKKATQQKSHIEKVQFSQRRTGGHMWKAHS